MMGTSLADGESFQNYFKISNSHTIGHTGGTFVGGKYDHCDRVLLVAMTL